MKTVLLVPGFQEDLKARDYKSVLNAIESKGYRAKFVPIQWKRTTIDDWLKELEVEYGKYVPKDTILAGFSYGSMTAFVAASKRLPAELWLFSFSPYFSDDLPKLKKSWKNGIGHRRVTAFSKLNFGQLAKQVTCPTLIMLGSVEADKYPLMVNRANIAKQAIKDSRYVIVDGADHDIADKNYVAAIKKAVG
jgi:pimeloyl-ACP methyl ester carboxylesterase